MTEMTYDKLVRDKIPEIITKNGGRPVTTTLRDDAYKKALLEKLVEEATELLESDGDIEERADVAEVLLALDRVCGFKADEMEDVRQRKAAARGGFEYGVFLEKVISD